MITMTSLRAIIDSERGGTYDAKSEDSTARERESSERAPVSGPSLQKLEMLKGSDERGPPAGRSFDRALERERERERESL